MTWYDLMVFAKLVQSDSTSRLARHFHGEVWSIEGQLLANLYDATNTANWQRAGRKHAPKPKRLPRPWEKIKATVLGTKPIPISQFNDWWDSHKPKRRAKKPPTAN